MRLSSQQETLKYANENIAAFVPNSMKPTNGLRISVGDPDTCDIMEAYYWDGKLVDHTEHVKRKSLNSIQNL